MRNSRSVWSERLQRSSFGRLNLEWLNLECSIGYRPPVASVERDDHEIRQNLDADPERIILDGLGGEHERSGRKLCRRGHR